jgi:hypothetical protein
MAYLSQTWSALRTRLQDRVEQQVFWDNQEALDATNEALQVWNLLTGMWHTTDTITTTAGTYLYTLPSTLLYRTRLTVAGRPLMSSSREELNLAQTRWRSETTASGGSVPTRLTLFAPVSLRSVYLWPADAVGGTVVTCEGIAATPVLVEDADFLDLGNELVDILLGYALHVLTFKKGGEAFAATTPLFQVFLQAATDRNRLIATTTVYRQIMGLDRRDLKVIRPNPDPTTVTA